MKNNKEIEKILLNDETYEKFVNSKIEKEFLSETEYKKLPPRIITDIKQADSNLLFTKNAIYLVMNKKSKTQSYVNGVQAEGLLGSQKATREKFLSKETDSFVCGDIFVKFVKLKV